MSGATKLVLFLLLLVMVVGGGAAFLLLREEPSARPEMASAREDGAPLGADRAGERAASLSRDAAERVAPEDPAPSSEDPTTAWKDWPVASFLSGQVVSSTGRPVEGARVRLERGGLHELSFLAFERRGPSPSDPSAQGVTGEDGRFQLSPVPRLEGMALVIDHPDHVILTREDVFVPERGMDIGRLELQIGGTVSGLVMDSAGQPLEGAEVMFRRGHSGPFEELAGGFRSLMLSAQRSVLTDRKGQFRLTGVFPVAGKVVARREGMPEGESKPFEVRAGEETPGISLVLEPGAELRGKVVNAAGKPIEGARIRARRDTNRFDFNRPDSDDESVRTAKDGTFVVTGLQRGRQRLSVEAKGYQSTRESAEAGSGKEVLITLQSCGALQGVVLSQGDERPIDGFTLRLEAERTDPQGLGLDMLGEFARGNGNVLDHEPGAGPGTFVVADVEPGRYRVVADVDGFDRGRSEVIEIKSGEMTDGVRILLEVGASLRGRVVGPAGDPVEGATVRARVKKDGADASMHAIGAIQRSFRINVGGEIESGGTGTTREQTRTNARGEFELTGLPPGRYQLTAEQDQLALCRGPEFELTRGQAVDDITLQMLVGGTVEGHVLDPSGVAMMGEKIGLKNTEYPDDSRNATTDGDGLYAFHHLPPGVYTVQRTRSAAGGFLGGGDFSIFLRGGGEAEADEGTVVEVKDAETTTLNFTDEQRPFLEGVVTSVEGPVAEATVQLVRQDEEEQRNPFFLHNEKNTVRTAPDGSYRLAELEPGVYRVEVRHPRALLPQSAEVDLRSTLIGRRDFFLTGGVIEGRVTTLGGDPVAGARVSIQEHREGSAHARRQGGMFVMRAAVSTGHDDDVSVVSLDGDGMTRTLKTDGSGRYSIPWVPDGTYRVKVSHDQFVEGSSDLVEVKDSAKVEGVGLTLTEGSIIHVRAFSLDDGKPLQHRAFSLLEENGTTRSFQITDSEGLARFTGLKPGTYTVQLNSFGRNESGKTVPDRTVTLEAGQSTELRFDL